MDFGSEDDGFEPPSDNPFFDDHAQDDAAGPAPLNWLRLAHAEARPGPWNYLGMEARPYWWHYHEERRAANAAGAAPPDVPPPHEDDAANAAAAYALQDAPPNPQGLVLPADPDVPLQPDFPRQEDDSPTWAEYWTRKKLYNSWAQEFGPTPGDDAIHALPQLAEDSEDDEDDSDSSDLSFPQQDFYAPGLQDGPWNHSAHVSNIAAKGFSN